jgi:TolB-like protein
MKKILSIIATLFVFTALSAQTVAVFDFECDDKDFQDKVTTMTDLLCHQLVQDGNVTLVERKNLDYVKQEMKFQMEGWTDSATVKQIGKMLNADCIIIGSVAALGCPLYITARMIEVETGKVLHSAKISLNVWSDYEKKLPQFAADCVARIPMPDYFVGTWEAIVSTDAIDYEYQIKLQPNGKCSVTVTTYNMAGNAVTQTAGGTYSNDKDFFRLKVNFRPATIENLRKLDWRSVYVFNDDKSSFNILVPADNNSKTADSRVTLVKVE